MIPRKIHYCWFGGKQLPDNIRRYMDSWRRFLPECEIKEWNELNFDINRFDYTREAYFAKKYAFVSDVARLVALVHEGGLYLDTDILFLKPLECSFWDKQAFVGFEHESFVGTGVMAAEQNHPFFREFLNGYKNVHFFRKFKYDEETNVSRITKLFLKKGLIPNNSNQIVGGVNIYKQDYFCNKNWRTEQYYNSEKSYAIHDFQSLWASKANSYSEKIINKFAQIKTILDYKCNQISFCKNRFTKKDVSF